MARLTFSVVNLTTLGTPFYGISIAPQRQSFPLFFLSQGGINLKHPKGEKNRSFTTRSVISNRDNMTTKKSNLEESHSTTEVDKISPGVTRVGWIGTGVMGEAMCAHIQEKGYSVTVYNRTISKTENLKAKGAKVATSPEEVARESDVVFTIVGYPSDVREVILGERGVLKGLKKGGIVVDMTTSQPSLAREIYQKALDQGCDAVDAPVSGGDRGAKSASLAIMTGGDIRTVEKLKPLLECMGRDTWMGGAGKGQSCKMANQVTIASTMVGLVEGMLYAHKAGLDVTTYLSAIRGGAAGSKSLDLYSERMMGRDFQPGFYVNHFVKDLGIALEECRNMELALPGLALAQQLYVSLQAHGEGSLGTQALLLSLERLNRVSLPQVKDS